MNSKNGRKLVFKRVENPEGWKSVYGCKVGYICTNIGRDAIAWWSNNGVDLADRHMQKFVDVNGDYHLVFLDREGNETARPTTDEIIWPRFTAVEVDGGWSVLDRWENKRHELVSPKAVVDRQVDALNLGFAPRIETGWIPYAPAPKEQLTPRFIEIDIEGGKSIYDTVTKQRRHHIWFNDDELKEVLDKWNDGMMGNPNDRGSKFLWIPHELPAPAPEQERRFCYVENPGYYKAIFPNAYGVIDNLKELIAWGCRVHREEEFNKNPEKAAEWTWHDKQGNEVVWESAKEPSGEPPAPEPQYIACQHGGKWEGDFSPDRWGVCRVADDHWCEACEDSKESAMNLVDGINNNNGQFTNWRWYRRRVIKRAGVPVPAPDMVNRPPHYTHSNIECIDAIRAALGDDGFIAFCRGTVIKYQWRAGLKDDAKQDLAKAAWYSQMAAHVADPERNQDPRNTECSSEGIIAGRGLCVKCYQTPGIRNLYSPQFVMTKQTENEDYGLYSITDAIRKKPHAVENWNLMRSELRGYLLAVSDALEKLEVLSGGKLGIPPEWNEIVLLVNSLPKAVLDEGAKKS